jgi:F-type H+-transporting ATPase subunit a
MTATIRRFLGALLLLAPLALPAQESAGEAVGSATAAEAVDDHSDFITTHITDGDHMEVPWFLPPFYKEVHLPHFAPVTIAGIEFDFSPTKHVIFMLLGAIGCFVALTIAARASVRDHAKDGVSRGFGGAIEAMALYLRNEVVLPNVGPNGQKYVPFALTLFFFILFMNLLGLIPYGATATGNIAVTATLAIITFVMVESAGIRAQGVGYLNTMFYWNNDLPAWMRPVMFLIMSPVEMIGKLTKPFALAIRLFANMTAGHIVVLALIGLIFTFKSYVIGTAPLLMAVAIMVLELFVAFLQAFIFTLLACVFIGQVREAHH